MCTAGDHKKRHQKGIRMDVGSGKVAGLIFNLMYKHCMCVQGEKAIEFKSF